jgi:hypothetical protein
VQRAKVDTALGDPLRADLCSVVRPAAPRSGPAWMDSDDDRRLGNCWFETGYGVAGVDKHVGRVGAHLEVLPTSFEHRPPDGAHQRHSHGITIESYPRSGTSCRRYVRLTGVTLLVDTYRDDPDALAAWYCATADDLVAGVVDTMTGAGFDRLPLASPTIATIDMCHTLTRSDLVGLVGQGDPTEYIADFGALCEWRSSTYDVTVSSSVTRDFSKILADRATVGGHPLILDTYADGPTVCRYSSPQGRITATKGEEFVDVDVRVLGDASNACSVARHAAVTVLNRTGLR